MFGAPNACGTDPNCIAVAQMLLGVPDAALGVSGSTNNDLGSHGISAYVQDDIHVIPRFLLNVGLRYEYNSPPVEASNLFSVPVLTPCSLTSGCIPCPEPGCTVTASFTPAGTDGIPRATYNPTRRDFAPRIGIAWRPMKSERWVVRSAYGIFYDVAIGNVNILPRMNPPLYDLNLYEQTATCADGLVMLSLCPIQDMINPLTGMNYGLVSMIDPHFRDGYMQQWNADLQYELGPNWMIDLAYVGSKGTHLTNVVDRDQADPNTGPPFAQFSSVLFVESTSGSNYHSMQFRTERRVTHGLAFLGAYTWSKSIDDVSNIFGGSVGSGLPQNSQNIGGERGPSDFNATNRVSASVLYDLPFGGAAGASALKKTLLANWQTGGIFSAQSGSPFTVVLPSPTGVSASAVAFGYPGRPNLVGDPAKPGLVAANPGCQAPAQLRTIGNWFNQCAFAQPASGTFISPGSSTPVLQFGTEGRNILTGPSFEDLDFSLTKAFPIRSEGQRVQFSGEFFNLFNHPNFDDPDHLFGAENFGSVLSSNAHGDKPPRQIQVSFRYSF
jgi:hypothetical protein